MWKFRLPRSLFEWVKPSAKERSRKPDLPACIPGVQLEFNKSFLFAPNSQQQDEDQEKERRKKNTCSSDPKKLCSNFFLDTFGWVGTAFFVGLHLRDLCWKKRHALVYKNESPQRNEALCGHLCNHLLPVVFNMQSTKYALKHNIVEAPLTVPPVEQESAVTSASGEPSEKEEDDISKVCQAIAGVTIEYFGQLENFSGISTKNKKAAYLHFRNGVKYGCPSAHFNLGICYEIGHGTRVDFVKAAEHYRMACNAGHNLAKYNLGVYYLEGKGGLPVDETQGLELISQAAGQGVLQAQTHMGIHFIEQEDWTKGVPYLEEASKSDPEARYYLGLCYENGWGVNGSIEQAKNLYHEAAIEGNSEATIALEMLSKKATETEKREIMVTENRRIHSHSSVPELVILDKETRERPAHHHEEVSRYLDIIFPDLWKKNPAKPSFWINDCDEVLTLKNDFTMQKQVVLPGLS